MTQSEWQILCDDTKSQMTDFLRGYCTPISAENQDHTGSVVGTGAFIEINDKKYTITNDHVISNLRGRQGAYHLTRRVNLEYGDYKPIAFPEPQNRESSPRDLAFIPVSEEAWQQVEHSNICVGKDVFSSSFEPCDCELFYFVGYPGDRSTAILDLLTVVAIPCLVQRPPHGQLPEENENDFFLPYPQESVWKSGDDVNVMAARPPGLSGSLVWDTRRVACLRKGIDWQPSSARVAGILKRWDENEGIVVGTKVDAISKSFPQQG
jgi:hypothetical protein